MKRMSELKDNLRGVKCDATKEAFNYLKSEKRKPRILEMPTARYIRVTIDGKKYDYSPTTGAWCPTSDRGRQGRWRDSESIEEFYRTAVNMSAGIYPPSQKQVGFLESLERHTGVDASPDAWADIKACSEEIDRLKRLRDRMMGVTSMAEEKKKPRLSAEEWGAVLFVNECQEHGRMPTLIELACHMGVDKSKANTLVSMLKEKGVMDGVESALWLASSHMTTHKQRQEAKVCQAFTQH